MKVLFVCRQNAGRSQMAQALYERRGGEARSAGTRPAARIHDVVVTAMREIGVDLAQRQPKELTPEDAAWADLVVTMGCGDECPVLPGKRYVDWQLLDPAEASIETVRAIRDQIERRVAAL